jgi:hypothetical protein
MAGSQDPAIFIFGRTSTTKLKLKLLRLKGELSPDAISALFPAELDKPALQHYCCNMIPALVGIPGSPWSVLPPGVHAATLAEVERTFTYNPRRRALFAGLVLAASHLSLVGCRRMLLDGSYVSAKPVPGDYDACWDPDGVNFEKLDAVFDDFDNGRANQKARFGGEFFPSTVIETASGAAFADFFQIDRFTGMKKGILSIALATDETVARRTKS